ncbi:MAG: calcium/sodium antiporter [Dehalococcoidales bacterium]|nr:MAG: calcium/sodium antiporter [Dehalococcoidales bacterium]
MLTYILFAIGFGLLYKGADLLVDGASALAKRLRISDLVIGLTVVAFGTSAPELIVNLYASVQGSTDIAFGNILGSNTFNILIILGISAIICPLRVQESTIWQEIPLSLLAVVIVGIMGNDSLIDKGGPSLLTRIDGILLLIFFGLFLYYIWVMAKGQRGERRGVNGADYRLTRAIIFVVVGLAGLGIGAKWVVDGAVKLAETLGINQSLVGLTIVATGTSLPELATSLIAAQKRNADIAVGNVVGSNIFNILFILGVSSIIRPLPVHNGGNIDIGVTIAASVFLFISVFTGRRRALLERWEGITFIVLYAGYVSYIILRAL